MNVFRKLKIWLIVDCYCQTPVLGLELGVDFTFANYNNNNNNLHLIFQVGILLEFDTEDQVLFINSMRAKE